MDLIEAMRTQGTCRYYLDRDVPDEVLYRAFEAARFGPQGGNRQPVRFVVVRDAAKKRQLKSWYLDQWKVYLERRTGGNIAADDLPKSVKAADNFAQRYDEVPALVVVCAEVNGLLATDRDLGRLSIVGGGSVYPTVQNFLLACRNEGLGSTLTTLLCAVEPKVKELLQIPDGVITAATIAIGWPAVPFPSKLTRLDVDTFVHVDSYDGRTLRPRSPDTADLAG